jgi:hypothetical protein
LTQRRVPPVVAIPSFFVLLFAVIVLSESACYPWAHTLHLRPVLVGRWVGELTATGRGRHVVFVDLRDDISDDSNTDLTGLVKMCDARGQTHEFGLSGRTLNWRGSSFRFTTFMTESHDRDGEGVRFGRVDGDWDRADKWHVSAKLELWRIRGGGAFSSTDRPPAQIALEDTPVQFTMTRATEREFRGACERLPSTTR